MFCSIFLLCDLINLKKQEDVMQLFSNLQQAKLDCWEIAKAIHPGICHNGYFEQSEAEFQELIFDFTKPLLLEQFPWLENANKESLNDGWPLPIKPCEAVHQEYEFMKDLAEGKHLSPIEFSV